ncbi:MAG: hypothetical protein ISQ11_16330 [Planctomycetes bacterium]|nr:hypothetical protein [Planctomycetota bacterium]
MHTTPLSPIVAALMVSVASAQTIDFETLPSGAPTADLQFISNEYEAAPFGVRFEIVDRVTGAFIKFPQIAKVGPPRTAFAGCPDNFGADTAVQNAGVCDSFLTDDSALGSVGNLRIVYTTPVVRASSVLLDVDAYSGTFEEWTISASNASGVVIATALVQHSSASPCGGYPGNGTATPWSVESPSGLPEIASIEIAFTGTAPVSQVGVAFDNFTPSEAGIGTPFTGCAPVANSTGFPAILFATGSPAIADNQLRVRAQGLPPNSIGYFLASQTLGNTPMAGGFQGTLCLGGSIGRLSGPGQVQGGGACGLFDLTMDLGLIPQPTGFVAVQPGESWSFQCWYRDGNPGPTANFSDAVSVVFF